VVADKKTILLLSDHPLSSSGVGTQARWLINGLINTGKWKFKCFGGAVKHEDYRTLVVNEDFIIKPTNGFGDRNMLRQVLATEKPDVLLLFTDPRFFIWVWEMEDEIHQVCPIAYNHLWDNYPWPEFNKVLYESTDLVNCINWPTYQMVKERFPEKTNYIPHAIPKEVYYPLPEDQQKKNKVTLLGSQREDHFTTLFVSRNARRKMPSDILVSWKQFMDELKKKHGHSKATLVMHTEPLDPEGPNLHHVVDMLEIKDSVFFSKDRIEFGDMNKLYNACDTVVNRSCFISGTRVLTKNGFLPIEEIQLGDQVMTHKKRWRTVTDLVRNSGKGKRLVTLKYSNGNAVTCTDDHKVMAIKKSELPKKFLINESPKVAIEYAHLIQVSELSSDDYVVAMHETSPVNERQDRRNGDNGSCRSWNVENTIISRIYDIEEEPEEHDIVYDLTVDEDHTYMVENITVSNCNEGFGLSTLEAMMCAKPIIAIKTGGLTRQVENIETGEQYGIGLTPDASSLVGNQMVPFIYEDYVTHEALANAFMEMYEWGPEKRKQVGLRALDHARKDYNVDNVIKSWDDTFTKLVGTWQDNRKTWEINKI
jgi:glycosyltransferase involved in cell wall biosynthesis